MDETPAEKAARHIKLLEQSRQNFIDTRALWGKRKAEHDPGADRMLALLERDLEMNAELLALAKERLAQLLAEPD